MLLVVASTLTVVAVDAVPANDPLIVGTVIELPTKIVPPIFKLPAMPTPPKTVNAPLVALFDTASEFIITLAVVPLGVINKLIFGSDPVAAIFGKPLVPVPLMEIKFIFAESIKTLPLPFEFKLRFKSLANP